MAKTNCVACGGEAIRYIGEGEVFDYSVGEYVLADKYECCECGCIWDE